MDALLRLLTSLGAFMAGKQAARTDTLEADNAARKEADKRMADIQKLDDTDLDKRIDGL